MTGSQNSWFDASTEQLFDRFELAWKSGEPPDLADFLAESHAPSVQAQTAVLEELVKIDMEYRWKLQAQGSTPVLRLEDYCQRFEQLQPSPELMAEEYRARHRWGDCPQLVEYRQRFGPIAAQLPECLPPSMTGRPISAVPQEDLSVASRTTPDCLDVANPATRPSVDVPPRFTKPAQKADAPTPFEPEPASPDPHAESDVKLAASQSGTENAPKVIGRYEVRSLLGTGTFGEVYLAQDPLLGREVAIKVPRLTGVRGNNVDDFLREARLVANIRHSALVEVFDVGHEQGRCFIVMEYIKGQSLRDVLAANRLDISSASQMLAQVAEAVHAAHTVGLIHRDLKPANILIDPAGRPHVTDFGLAMGEDEQRRKAWQVSGTPAYMAPEQVRGESHRMDGRADIWSLGVILYEIITGRRPFGGSTVDDLFDEIIHREPRPPRQIDDRLPAELERICLKCLAKRVRDRYTTCRDLAQDLQHFSDSPLAGSKIAGALRLSSVEIPAPVTPSRMDYAPSAVQDASRLPKASNRFVGRQPELDDLVAAFQADGARIVTLLGPGGIGKTRLASEAALALAPSFSGGAWWVDISAASTSTAVAEAVLRAFGVPVPQGQTPESCVAHLLEFRHPLLLVLDNFEQAVDVAHDTVGHWRAQAPHVRFLVTSRASLGLSGERHYELDPLPVPRDAGISVEDSEKFASVQLFCERAAESFRRFELSSDNVAAVAEICARLDGIPLAVELAAARVGILKPEQIVRKLDQKFQLLRSSRRDVVQRQQTLLGTIEWSYDLLTPSERRLFMLASWLPGGFFLEAAEAIIDLGDDPDAPMLIDVLQSLREKSMLRTHEALGEMRFSMYASIREYGFQKLQRELPPAACAEVARRAAHHYIQLAEHWNARIHTADGHEALDRISLEIENLFATQDWALTNDAAELAAQAALAMNETLAVRGPAEQRLPRIDAALSQAAPPLQIPLLTARSAALRSAGRVQEGLNAAEEAVRLIGENDTSVAAARALWQRGEMLRVRGDVPGASQSFTASHQCAVASGSTRDVAAAMNSRGFVVWQQGQLDEAVDAYAEAEQLFRSLGDDSGTSLVLRNRGYVLAQRSQYPAALRCFSESESLAKRQQDRRTMQLATAGRGMVLADQGDFVGALACFDRAEKLARQLGEKRGIAVNQGNKGLVFADQGSYQKALECYRMAESINRELGTVAGMALNIGNRGVALAGLGQYAQALECLGEAERLHRQLGNRMQAALNVGERGIVMLKISRTPEARAALEESLAVLRELSIDHSPEYFNFCVALAAVCCKLDSATEAEPYLQAARHLAEELSLSPTHARIRIRENLALLEQLSDD